MCPSGELVGRIRNPFQPVVATALFIFYLRWRLQDNSIFKTVCRFWWFAGSNSAELEHPSIFRNIAGQHSSCCDRRKNILIIIRITSTQQIYIVIIVIKSLYFVQSSLESQIWTFSCLINCQHSRKLGPIFLKHSGQFSNYISETRIKHMLKTWLEHAV